MGRKLPKLTADDLTGIVDIADQEIGAIHELTRLSHEKGFEGEPDLGTIRQLLTFGNALNDLAKSLLYNHRMAQDLKEYEALKAQLAENGTV